MKLFSFLVKVIVIITISNSAYAARIGVFTGTFDPPHDGHKDTVRRAIKYGNLDIIYIETGIPQHKPNALPYEVRMEMLNYVFQDVPEVTPAAHHVKAMFRSKNYTGAIRELLRVHKDDTFFRIIGSDKFSSDSVLSMDDTNLQYIVNPRDQSELTLPYAPTILNRVKTVLLPPSKFQTSSTEIRNNIKSGIKNPHLDPYIYEKILAIGAYSSQTCKFLL